MAKPQETRTTQIHNSASICTDMMINADVTILPATQPTPVSDSLKKLHLYNKIFFGPATDVITGKKIHSWPKCLKALPKTS